jgi:hypothetical protein
VVAEVCEPNEAAQGETSPVKKGDKTLLKWVPFLFSVFFFGGGI